jgi:hypothetical protein
VGDPSATKVPDGYDALTFADVDWTPQPLYIRTKISLVPGVWLDMGNAQLVSVPYSMISESAYNVINNPVTMNNDTVLIMNSVDVVGNYDTTEDEALFEVKRKDGQTMFGVYNQGVRINIPMVDNVPKGAKGGFSIGGFGTTKGGYLQELFTLNKDSARIYLDKTPDLSKGAKGGFAIGGFALTGKENWPVQNYLFIAPDSARIYVKNSGKGVKGGFAIGGFSGSKASTINFMDITPDNYFIGHESGKKIDGGLYNSVLGYQAGKSLITGYNNTIIGNQAGTSVSGGYNNIIIGDNAGFTLNTGYSNTVIGYRAGHSLTDQSYDVLVGHESGFHLSSPGWSGGFNAFFGVASGWAIQNSLNNTFLGINAGMFLDNGTGNTIIGTDAGRAGLDPDPWVPRGYVSDYNTIIGNNAGYNITEGDNNVFIGFSAGSSATTGSGNVFLGTSAGSSETGSNKLYIANSSGTALIYGDFASGRIGLGTLSPAYKLDVVGDVNITGNFRVNGTPIATSLTTGDLTASGPVSVSPTRQVVGGAAVISIADASTSEKGAVMLSNKYDGESEILATTEKALSDGLATKVNGAGIRIVNVNLTADGSIVTNSISKYILYWKAGNDWIELVNEGSVRCIYWYQTQTSATTKGESGSIDPGYSTKIIVPSNIDFQGCEIHFGPVDGSSGWCSVWLQYYDGVLVGHYIL